MGQWTIGIIGGSGLYAIDALEEARWQRVESPWGAPSDALLTGTIAGHRFVFLPRHGRGHVLSPADIDYRANIDVLKRAGCTDVLAISAVGSLREELPPGHFVVVDQFIDRALHRQGSFFDPFGHNVEVERVGCLDHEPDEILCPGIGGGDEASVDLQDIGG